MSHPVQVLKPLDSNVSFMSIALLVTLQYIQSHICISVLKAPFTYDAANGVVLFFNDDVNCDMIHIPVSYNTELSKYVLDLCLKGQLPLIYM